MTHKVILVQEGAFIYGVFKTLNNAREFVLKTFSEYDNFKIAKEKVFSDKHEFLEQICVYKNCGEKREFRLWYSEHELL